MIMKHYISSHCRRMCKSISRAFLSVILTSRYRYTYIYILYIVT